MARFYAPTHNGHITTMPQPRTARNPSPRRRVRRKRNAIQLRLDRWRNRARQARRILEATPPAVRTIAFVMVAIAIFAAVNLVYHVVRKPTEMLFPVSGVLRKIPAETWRQYGSLFREYSTGTITPELLAALAQVEGAGDPVAHTYWRWQLAWPPFGIYKPASSAVGMYQMTDPTFADAKRYCIRHHTVVEGDAWGDWNSCWFTDLYSRVLPSHAIELTAAHLDRSVAAILGHQPNVTATSQQKQDIAAIVHLCGAGPAKDFARRGFRFMPGERCGDHDPTAYLEQVDVLARQFRHLAAER